MVIKISKAMRWAVSERSLLNCGQEQQQITDVQNGITCTSSCCPHTPASSWRLKSANSFPSATRLPDQQCQRNKNTGSSRQVVRGLTTLPIAVLVFLLGCLLCGSHQQAEESSARHTCSFVHSILVLHLFNPSLRDSALPFKRFFYTLNYCHLILVIHSMDVSRLQNGILTPTSSTSHVLLHNHIHAPGWTGGHSVGLIFGIDASFALCAPSLPPAMTEAHASTSSTSSLWHSCDALHLSATCGRL
jgi:hypothetical protein